MRAPTRADGDAHHHRLLVFSHSGDLRGAERALLANVRTLVETGTEVVVVVAKRGPLIDRLREVGATVHRHPMPPWLARKAAWPVFLARAAIALVCLPRLVWLIRRVDPCMAYTNSLVTPEGAIAARLARVPHIWHLREYVPGNETLRGRLSLRRIMRTTATLSVTRLAVSAAVAEQCHDDGGTRPIVVSAGLDPLRFAADRPAPDAWLAAGSPAIAVVGALSAAKGVDLAVDVLHRLRTERPDARLLLVGEGAPRFVTTIRRTVEGGGDGDAVRMIDFIDDVRAVFDAADVVLVPSRYEAYGLITLEAMAAGAPVVGSASGGTRDLLAQCGLLAVPADPAHFATLIAAAVDDPALRAWMVKQGQRVVSTLDPAAEATAIRIAVDQGCARSARRP